MMDSPSLRPGLSRDQGFGARSFFRCAASLNTTHYIARQHQHQAEHRATGQFFKTGAHLGDVHLLRRHVVEGRGCRTQYDAVLHGGRDRKILHGAEGVEPGRTKFYTFLHGSKIGFSNLVVNGRSQSLKTSKPWPWSHAELMPNRFPIRWRTKPAYKQHLKYNAIDTRKFCFNETIDGFLLPN